MGWEQISGPNFTIPSIVLLNTMTPNNVASSNDTTSLSLSSFFSYDFVFDSIVPAVNNSVFQMQVATTDSNFVVGGYVSSVTVDGGGQGANQVTTDSYTTSFLLSGLRSTSSVGNNTSYGITGTVRLFTPSGNHRSMMNGQACLLNGTTSGTASLCVVQMGGYFDSNSVITGVNFVFDSGNIATGTIKVYGRR